MNKKKAKRYLFSIPLRLKTLENEKKQLRAQLSEIDKKIKELTEKFEKLSKKLGYGDKVKFKKGNKKLVAELRKYSGLNYDPEKLRNKLSRKITVEDYKKIIVEQEPKINKEYLNELFERGEITLEDIEGTYEEYETRKPKIYLEEVE